ncbi:Fur family transcriptional regulator [Legionella bozemanae]|uniref:Fur family transcriptional regulator n=1 Tax=Legionella bozemanae TaxID=447 RepID=UPI001040F388|nr:Fur family transcriptional regulator [Legionella bozemanae]
MKYNLLDKAYKHCIKHGYRFTEPRERVLKILVEERTPLGAYEILQKLSEQTENPKPPTVYRAIQFWHQEGFIHCIDSLKSYVACLHGDHMGQAQFLICSHCGFVKELESVVDFSAVTEFANSIQFSIINCTVEIKGLCARCKLAHTGTSPN